MALELALSPFRLVRSGPLLLAELAVAAVVVALWLRRGRPSVPRPQLRRPAGPALVLAVAVALALVYAVVLVVVTAPNTYDSLTYHLPRAAQWYQHHGWYWIQDAPTSRQNVFPPGAELGILFTFVAAGSDRFAEAPQLLALLAAVVAVYGLARRLGFRQAHSLFAALVFPTLSAVALQSTTTKNDIVVTAFTAAAAYFLLGRGDAELALAGLALALALGTKTAAVLSLPGLVVLAAATMHWRRLARLAVYATVSVFVLAAWPYLRNLAETGSLLAGDGVDEHRAATKAEGVLATTVRLAYRFLDLSGYEHVFAPVVGVALAVTAWLVAVSVRKWHRGRSSIRPGAAAGAALILLSPLLVVLGAAIARRAIAVASFDIDPESATRVPFDWSLSGIADEDISYFGPLGAFLLVAAFVAAARRSGRYAGARLALVVGFPIYVLGLAAVYRYNPWLGRFLLGARDARRAARRRPLPAARPRLRVRRH